MGAGDTSKKPEIIDMRVSRFSHKQTEKISYQIEAEEFPGAFKPIISINYNKNCEKKTKPNLFAVLFPYRPPKLRIFDLWGRVERPLHIAISMRKASWRSLAAPQL